jgi:hypothetical protein
VEKIKNIIDWFLTKGRESQTLIICMAVCGLLAYDRHNLQKQINQERHDKITSDSLFVVRHNATVHHFQETLDECNKKRIEMYIKQNEKWQAKFEALFKESDKFYYELNKFKEQ